jgi:elongation factor Ts
MEKIKELREKTGAGIGDCKKALDETNGDIEKAIEVLRKKGIAKAAKRSDRETSEGVIKMSVSEDNKTAFILQISAETDFVARNEQFQETATKIMELIEAEKPADLEALLALSMGDMTVLETTENMSGVIGEKIAVTKYEMVTTEGTVAAYDHMNGRIGAVVALDQEGKVELASDIAMQIAASNPKYIDTNEVPEAEIEKEKEVYKEQLLKDGKPEEMIEKIMPGKVNKYFEEVCLLKQEFIKEDKKKVEQVLDGAKIEKAIRFSL